MIRKLFEVPAEERFHTKVCNVEPLCHFGQRGFLDKIEKGGKIRGKSRIETADRK